MAEAPDELQTAGGLMATPHGPALMVSFCYCGVVAHGERIADRWRKWLRPTKDTVQAGGTRRSSRWVTGRAPEAAPFCRS